VVLVEGPIIIFLLSESSISRDGLGEKYLNHMGLTVSQQHSSSKSHLMSFIIDISLKDRS
jgi:hypothetical protein